MDIWNDEEHLKKGFNKILSGTFFPKKPAHKITESDMRSDVKTSIQAHRWFQTLDRQRLQPCMIYL